MLFGVRKNKNNIIEIKNLCSDQKGDIYIYIIPQFINCIN